MYKWCHNSSRKTTFDWGSILYQENHWNVEKNSKKINNQRKHNFYVQAIYHNLWKTEQRSALYTCSNSILGWIPSKGSFDNYVDKILSILPTQLTFVDKHRHFTDNPPTPNCPLSYWMALKFCEWGSYLGCLEYHKWYFLLLDEQTDGSILYLWVWEL